MLSKIKQFLVNILASLFCIALAFGILDGLWLGWFAMDWYQQEMAGLLRSEFITWPWVTFYAMYIVVTFILTIVPNRDKPWFYASIDGALLGFACYGTYNLTAHSVIEGFSFSIMIIDWCWGTFITSMSATAGWFGFQALAKNTSEKA